MSILGPRGRHRSPGKLSTSFNSTARVSATVAVAGGLVASIAAPQAAQAQAATGVASITGASSASFASQAARSHAIANPLKVTAAKQQLAVVEADPQLASAVKAASYVKPVVRPAVSSVSRGTTRTAPTTSNPPTSTPAPPPTVGGIVGIAERFSGVPYVFGGSSPAGFDCSGFTSYVYRLAGISIPRTATAQMLAATRVSNPQPGDLVFFGSGSYAYHVGIYLGNGMMIDSNHPGGSVGIRPLYNGVSGYGRF